MTPESGSALLEVNGLGFAFGPHAVLDVERLRVARGEAILLVGDNGSGKTTLLKILAGLLVAAHGAFRCLGNPMNPREAARFCRGRHVYLHQSPYMFDGSVEDNIAYGLKLRGRDLTQRRIEIRDMLAWADLDHLVHRPARQLSTGEKQRVALTRARILAPSLLLLDEITANMDGASRRRTHAMIADLKQAGSSVVFATHDHASIEALCEQRLALTEGRLEALRTAAGADVIPLHRDGTLPTGRRP
ncbi:MAG: ABC transporter ATP-binding protein [Gammaproteobacteria bacterium]